MQAISCHDHIQFPTWNVRQERDKFQQFEYLDNKKSILGEIKSIFNNFKGHSTTNSAYW